jgi:hypothetical protein
MSPPALYFVLGALSGGVFAGLLGLIGIRIMARRAREQSARQEARYAQRIEEAVQIERDYQAQQSLASNQTPAPKRRGQRAEGDKPHTRETRGSNPSASLVLPNIPAPVVERIPKSIPESDISSAFELSDEEIDALPPELPTATKLHKRVLATPAKQSMQNI